MKQENKTKKSLGKIRDSNKCECVCCKKPIGKEKKKMCAQCY